MWEKERKELSKLIKLYQLNVQEQNDKLDEMNKKMDKLLENWDKESGKNE